MHAVLWWIIGIAIWLFILYLMTGFMAVGSGNRDFEGGLKGMKTFLAGIVVLLYMAFIWLTIKVSSFIVDKIFKYIPRIWKR